MLIRYTFKNFRSFKDSTTLDMVASSQRTKDSCILRKFNMRILPSVVIYGANASGKSNIITSMDTLSQIIRLGSISENAQELRTLEMYPFIHENSNNPIFYEVEFTNDEWHFIYQLSFEVGKFEHGKRKIVSERLDFIKSTSSTETIINLFERDAKHVQISKNKKAIHIMDSDAEFIKQVEVKINENLDCNELFLSRGFKNSINSRLADSVIDFFVKKLFVINDIYFRDAEYRILANKQIKKNFHLWNDMLEGFVRKADFGPQDIRFSCEMDDDGKSGEMQLNTTYKNIPYSIPSKDVESKGTLKLIEFAVIFQHVFSTGGTLVIDEFDSALHPEIVKGLIAVFNDSSLNKHAAQLIFTSHNPIYLNNKIFRRDQICFVEKDSVSYRSALYSLADLGSESVRNDENYLLNYFKGKYTALPYIDFSALINNEED